MMILNLSKEMLAKPIMTKIEPIEINDNEDVVDGDNTVEIINTV